MLINGISAHIGDYVFAKVGDVNRYEIYIDDNNNVNLSLTTVPEGNKLREQNRKLASRTIIFQLIDERHLKELISGETISITRYSENDKSIEQGSKGESLLLLAKENPLCISMDAITGSLHQENLDNLSPETMSEGYNKLLNDYSITLNIKDEIIEYFQAARELSEADFASSLESGKARVQNIAEEDNKAYDSIMRSLEFLRGAKTVQK